MLPTIVLGAAILQYASALGFARSFWALFVGHVVLVTPYVMRTTLASLAGSERALEEAAQDLGANRIETFFLITLPQIKPGVIAGALFAFINSWINVEVSIFNSTSQLVTLPVKLFNYIQFNIDPTLAAVSAADDLLRHPAGVRDRLAGRHREGSGEPGGRRRRRNGPDEAKA